MVFLAEVNENTMYKNVVTIFQCYHYWFHESRLTVVSREAKEEVPCDGLSTNAREYFTRTNLVKIKNAITDEPKTLGLYYSS